jgi:hypothetical protein
MYIIVIRDQMEGGFDFLEPVELRVELKESIFTNAS